MQRDSNDIDLYPRMTAMSLGNTNRRTAMSLGNTNRRIVMSLGNTNRRTVMSVYSTSRRTVMSMDDTNRRTVIMMHCKQNDLDLIPLRFSFLFKSNSLWTLWTLSL